VAKYWHRWGGFWIRIANRKQTDFILWRQHLGGRGRKCNHNLEIIVTNSGRQSFPGFENNQFNEREQTILLHKKNAKVIAVHLEEFEPL
jgi:hypothetical protein